MPDGDRERECGREKWRVHLVDPVLASWRS